MSGTAAVILAGGRARRLGGVDKGAVVIGEATMLAHALAAAGTCRPRVVVGTADQVPEDVVVVREDPPGGGPVAAIEAGLAMVPTDCAWVLVLACDMPGAARAVAALRAATTMRTPGAEGEGGDGAWALDDSARHQPLLALYRHEALRRALARMPRAHGGSMRELTSSLSMVPVSVGHAARDADTWDDVRTWRKEWR